MHPATQASEPEEGQDYGHAGVEGICEILRERIRRGYYDSLGRLPDEFTLIRELGISRTRLRAALERLSGEGLVVRRRGLGTFVPTDRLSFQSHQSGGFTHFASQTYNRAAAHRLISSSTWAMDPISAREFSAERGAPMHMIERCSYLDGEPFSVATYVVRGDLAPAMLLPTLRDQNLDMRTWLARSATEEIGWVDATVDAVAADPESSHRLGCAIGAPLLRLNRHFHLPDGRLLAYGSNTSRGDRYVYQAVREQLGTAPI